MLIQPTQKAARLISDVGKPRDSIDMIKFTDKDLKEIFAIFSSATKYELSQIYDESGYHHFENVDLDGEYELTESKREFALDSIRAVLFWLSRHKYSLSKDGEKDDLSWLKDDLFSG
jgi:hypothetical protein